MPARSSPPKQLSFESPRRHSVISLHRRTVTLSTLWRLAVLSTLVLASTGCATRGEPARTLALPTADSVDLASYAGRWYEIALLPNRFQRQCVADTEASYRADSGTIEVVNRCRVADGSIDVARGRAKVVPGSGNAKLRVTFFWPFYGDYWILALDPAYSEVLVGSPDRRYAWVLARRPDLPEARLQALLGKAQALGFDATAFRRTPQTQPLLAGAADSQP